jgi:hypothetical protein
LHSGIVRPFGAVATIPSGATPFVTQLSSAWSVSKLFGATPPPQCPMPGTMNRRALSCV